MGLYGALWGYMGLYGDNGNENGNYNLEGFGNLGLGVCGVWGFTGLGFRVW